MTAWKVHCSGKVYIDTVPTGIALTHPIVIGNKNTVFITTDVFPRRNGYRSAGDHRAIEDCIVDSVAEPERHDERLTRFITLIRLAL